MKLVIGLGNPGKEYEKTRHNVGFMVLDVILKKIDHDNLKWKKRVGAAVMEIPMADVETQNSASLQADGEKILLVAPQKFMNQSGQVVADLQKFYDVENNDILIICDDLNLEFGQIRLRKSGSGGNHNGLKDIVNHIGENFNRIRIGIKNDYLTDASKWQDFVLANFNKDEEKSLVQIFDLAADYVLKWIGEGKLEGKTLRI